MRFFGETHIDFIGLRRKAFLLSGIIIAIGITSIVLKGGLKLGLDFTGGIEVHLKFEKSPSVARIRSGLAKIGLSKAIIQQYGKKEENLVLIRYKVEEASQEIASEIINYRRTHKEFTALQELRNIPGIEAVGYEELASLFTLDPLEKEKVELNQIDEESLVSLIRQVTHRKIAATIEEGVKKEFEEGENSFLIQSINLIGPQVSKELQKSAILAIVFALIGMLIYIAWRFELKFALGAVIALAHDVFISVAALSLANYEITLPIIAAVLTIIGYSLNDTIVVYDRIRENLKTHRKGRIPLKEIINLGVNQSLSRTIITSLTTLLVVSALFIWGGAIIHGFAFALLIGVIVGTYSSDFIAAPVVYSWRKKNVTKRT